MTDHTFDVEATAARINVVPDVLRGLVDKCREDVTITAVHGYNGAVAIVELDEPITMQDADGEPYALLSWSGYIFPFHPDDMELLTKIMNNADHEFEKSDDPYPNL
jgi:hypothetical protein